MKPISSAVSNASEVLFESSKTSIRLTDNSTSHLISSNPALASLSFEATTIWTECSSIVDSSMVFSPFRLKLKALSMSLTNSASGNSSSKICFCVAMLNFCLAELPLHSISSSDSL